MIRVPRIYPNLRVVERPSVGVVHLLPGLAAVLRAIEAVRELLPLAVLRGRRAANRIRLDAGIDDVRDLRIDRDHDAALLRFGEASALDLRPAVSGVRGFPEAGARAARDEEVRAADALVRGGPHHIRVLGVDRDVDETGLVVDELHELPRLAAVLRLVESALGARLPRGA